MKLVWKPWCQELHTVSIDWLNMCIEKEWWYLSKVLISCKELVKRCLDCPYLEWCDKKEANIKFLEHNK